MKKSILLILLCIVSFSVASCGVYYENATFITRNNEESYVLYQGKAYYPSSVFITSQDSWIADETNIPIGWYYSFPFGTDFYSDTAEAPVFIYAEGPIKRFYLREDYNYFSEKFIIEGTSNSFVFSEAIIEPSFEYEHSLQTNQENEIIIYALDHSHLKISLLLFSNNEKWVVVLPSNEAYFISPMFLDILKEYQIIEN